MHYRSAVQKGAVMGKKYMLVKPAKINGERLDAGTIVDGENIGNLHRVNVAVPMPEQSNANADAGTDTDTDTGEFNYETASVDEVLAAVEDGTISKDEALEAELDRKNPRKGVLSALEE